MTSTWKTMPSFVAVDTTSISKGRSEQTKNGSKTENKLTTPTPGPPISRLEKLRAKIHKNPWDSVSWTAYLAEASTKNDNSVIRQAFDEHLAQFPTSAKNWISYLEFEQNNKAYDKIDTIYNTCLRSVLSCELWKNYLNYIKRTHSPGLVPTDRKAEAHAIVERAFEFVLQNVGMDKESGTIWADYIHFIKSSEFDLGDVIVESEYIALCEFKYYLFDPFITSSQLEEQQNNEKMRRIFHRALVTPLSNIEQLWKEYDTFENKLDKLLAKKIISGRHQAYMTARFALKELRNMMEGIEKMQKFWVATPPEWSDRDVKLSYLWKRYIAWEKSNPLKYEDKALIHSRVMFVYKSALLMLRHFPEIWHDAGSFLIESGRLDEASIFLKQGVEALPRSLLLSFALAELEEQRKKDYETEIKPIFETLLQNLDNQITLTNERYDEERKKMKAAFDASDEQTSIEGNNGMVDAEMKERERSKQREREKQFDVKVEERRRKEIDSLKKCVTLTWIAFMKIARRTQVFTL
ncbi:mRNA 3'-end-processing protein rna14 [Nowakowskiella sp. JEL0078]|nr:mRNA 3'-end-processing protein rna14 [Nowakowskiella sp. JEL0078]